MNEYVLATLPFVLHGGMDSFALLAIPLFILLQNLSPAPALAHPDQGPE